MSWRPWSLAGLILPAFLIGPIPTQVPALSIDTVQARRYLQEAATVATRDGGHLWGIPLDAPLLFAARADRTVLADRQAPDGSLHPLGAWFIGTLPPSEPIANNAIRWAGRTWTMLVWPLETDSLERQVLLAHELWHGIQDTLGFGAGMPDNAHLGTRDGRLWLRLEGRALAAALSASGSASRRAIEDAVAFRRFRRARFPGAGSTERALELAEGLAEYTGVALAGTTSDARRTLALRRLATLDSAAHFERDFAYHTGPAWGLLLDELAPGWPRQLKPSDDLADLTVAALGGRRPAGPAAVSRAARYGYSSIRHEEDVRIRARQKQVAALHSRFVTGPVLALPLSQMKMSFDPGKVEALDSLGSVYGMLRLSDRWGVLQCDLSGGLIAGDFRRALVPAPADTSGRRLIGPGWVLELLPGWRLVAGPRPGDWMVAEVP